MDSSQQSMDIWKAYIRFQQRMQTTDPLRYKTVPDAVNRLTPEQINALTESDIAALQSAGALPPVADNAVSMETVRAVRAYLLAQKPNLPPILQNLSDDEIRNLGPDKVQALRCLNLLPDALPENTTTELLQASHPTLAPIPEQPIPEQPIPPMPEYDYTGYSPYGYRHDPLTAIEHAGQLYNEAAKNFTRSIEKQNDAMGRAFRKAGG